MSAFSDLLESFRANAQTECEKGNSYESLVKLYLQKKPLYEDLYCQVWIWSKWRKHRVMEGFPDSGIDTGIGLVAKTRGTKEYHAIQTEFMIRTSSCISTTICAWQ